MRRKTTISLALAAILVLSGISTTVGATNGNDGQSANSTASTMVDIAPSIPNATVENLEVLLDEFDLDDASQAAIVEELDGMRAEGASRQDVHHALHYLLYQEGYEVGDVHVQRASLTLQERFEITDGEADEIAQTGRELRADGASWQEVKVYVYDALQELGVDATPGPGGPIGPNGHGPTADRAPNADRPDDGQRLGALAEATALDDEQVDELRAGIESLRESGATPGEIHQYVQETLSAYGVDVSDLDIDRTRPKPGISPPKGHHEGPHR